MLCLNWSFPYPSVPTQGCHHPVPSKTRSTSCRVHRWSGLRRTKPAHGYSTNSWGMYKWSVSPVYIMFLGGIFLSNHSSSFFKLVGFCFWMNRAFLPTLSLRYLINWASTRENVFSTSDQVSLRRNNKYADFRLPRCADWSAPLFTGNSLFFLCWGWTVIAWNFCPLIGVHKWITGSSVTI